jgi:hypothetical protein
MAPIARLTGETNLHAFAYTPGYCTLPTWTERFGIHEFRARRNADPREQRVRYIGQVLQDLLSRCSQNEAEGTQAARATIVPALVAEARSVAQTPFEHYLVDRIARVGAGKSADETHLPRGRSFAIVEESRLGGPIMWDAVYTTCRACSRIAAPQVRRAGDPPPAPTGPSPYTLVCRSENNCDLERRNANGATYLYELIEDADSARMKPLLEAGADPNAERYPGGPTGLDALLQEMREGNAEHAQRALEAIRALARDGRATLRKEAGKGMRDFASRVGDAQRRASLESIAALLDSLPERPAFAPLCPVTAQFLIFDPPPH